MKYDYAIEILERKIKYHRNEIRKHKPLGEFFTGFISDNNYRTSELNSAIEALRKEER